MIIFILLVIPIFFYIILRTYKYKKNLKNKKIIFFNKNNFYEWMNLTKKERYNLSKKYYTSYLNRRKVLLDQIRKEYKSIPKAEQRDLS